MWKKNSPESNYASNNWAHMTYVYKIKGCQYHIEIKYVFLYHIEKKKMFLHLMYIRDVVTNDIIIND